ncbi:hypothetical protein B2J93_8573 [Marssonina coronariae]|uniref:2EXR domain-containing protein n=1 Tax=Diplocarpon coronariae TaxID=2795749 RepID=A0A218YWX0_9HELO|nr:hypothetical protein B2J93_8573 [Marssonina coronariae]
MGIGTGTSATHDPRARRAANSRKSWALCSWVMWTASLTVKPAPNLHDRRPDPAMQVAGMRKSVASSWVPSIQPWPGRRVPASAKRGHIFPALKGKHAKPGMSSSQTTQTPYRRAPNGRSRCVCQAKYTPMLGLRRKYLPRTGASQLAAEQRPPRRQMRTTERVVFAPNLPLIQRDAAEGVGDARGSWHKTSTVPPMKGADASNLETRAAGPATPATTRDSPTRKHAPGNRSAANRDSHPALSTMRRRQQMEKGARHVTAALEADRQPRSSAATEVWMAMRIECRQENERRVQSCWRPTIIKTYRFRSITVVRIAGWGHVGRVQYQTAHWRHCQFSRPPPNADSRPAMTSLAEFHGFPNLPSELRLKIWAFALRRPRVVNIAGKKAIDPKRTPRRFVVAFLSTTPRPAMINACQESRSEALATYRRYFQTEHAPNCVYLAPDRDAVRCSDNLLEHFGPDEVGAVERLVLDVADAGYFGHFNMAIIASMARLTKLDLYTDEGDLTSWRGGNVRILSTDFEGARKSDPGWACPRVRIIDRHTGAEVLCIERGALAPGWRPGDPNPFLT